jgi:gamma-glutamyltranspeptidase/glutathione hydrolase
MRRSRPLSSLALLLASLWAFLPAGPQQAQAARQPSAATHGMVVSTSQLASQVGVDILQKGGNAVDAAVAVALALAVTWPAAGNLGGGGFMLVRRADGTTEIIDYRERAPLAARRDMYLDARGRLIPEASTVGYLAAAVPGTVAGLALARERHGKLPWAELVRPARRLAEEGFPLNYQTILGLRQHADLLGRFPDSRRIFLKDGKLYQVGERLVQRELGETLGRLEKNGPREFYEGETARRLVEDMKRHGGLITLVDLKENQPRLRQPLRGTYRGHEILTMPPPSSGGPILLEMLNMLERYPLAELGHNSAEELHVLVEVMRRAFADRAAHLGDADFVKVPVAGLIAKSYAAKLVASIDRAHASTSLKVQAGTPLAEESPETTHFTVVDAEGNVVTNTYTLNGSFGAGATATGLGFLLNNEMDDFTSKVGSPNAYGVIQGENNAIAPRKRPLSSMTPTIVLKDGKLLMAVGSPGGPTIINTVLQVLINVIDFGMNLQQAIDQPRIHHQWLPDHIQWEPWGMSRDTRTALEQRGHHFAEKPGYMGDAHGIMIDAAQGGLRLGACDPRFAGIPIGY